MSPNLQIKRITLVNFQIFEKQVFEFTNGLNIIVGDNNSGKSSLIRAIYWVYTNKPAGTWMCKFDDEDGILEASVLIEYTDGTKVSRIRGPKANMYRFNEHKFEKFGRNGIPQIIEEFLGKVSLPVSKDIVPNIAMQDELPFMVFESGRFRS